ncbi:hypothetical protein V1L54_29230 [Streptomyces sp. TRM 70361]|uniref:hypothetical protein n=1 Tax=Streptomyces sp. TRM 70361 TaxID=3116553 RepID=UPI002E7BB062|nr:hypothetical protein [Streptomyces sp. TRM 70361]MEE1943435.1 hypothetical protein [Streptomyces sp. TRM 70361]
MRLATVTGAIATVMLLGAGAGPAAADEQLPGQVVFYEGDYGGRYVLDSHPTTECTNLPFATRLIANLAGPIEVFSEADCRGSIYHSPTSDLHNFPKNFSGLSYRLAG